jgi:HPt (histidine-containing phosphotransfer) domain-containing protein
MSATRAVQRGEIRDRVTTIIAATAMLLDTRLDAAQRELAATVNSSGQALLVLLGQSSDFPEVSIDQRQEPSIAPDEAIERATGVLVHEIASRDSEYPVIDLAAIMKVAEADEPGSNFLGEIAELFLSDLTERIVSISLALQQSDDALMAATAHSIKGSCGHFGARYLMELCGDIEARAQRGQTRGLDVTVNSMIAESERVRDALQIYRSK